MGIFISRILAYLLISVLLYPQSGKVVGVKDGDTIEMLLEGKSVTIRLAEIDCPEKGQPYGTKAKQITSDLCIGKTVKLVRTDVDGYGRIVGHIILPDGSSLSHSLVSMGFAWWYEKYSSDLSIKRLQQSAQKSGLGLWADKDPIPPWLWRKGVKDKSKPKPQCLAITKKGTQCSRNAAGDSKYCNQHKISNDSAFTSLRCKGTTKKGTQCSRKASPGDSYCYQHKK